jgi:hypothetical protein
MADTRAGQAAAPYRDRQIFFTPYLMLMVSLFYLVVSVAERCEKVVRLRPPPLLKNLDPPLVQRAE